MISIATLHIHIKIFHKFMSVCPSVIERVYRYMNIVSYWCKGRQLQVLQLKKSCWLIFSQALFGLPETDSHKYGWTIKFSGDIHIFVFAWSKAKNSKISASTFLSYSWITISNAYPAPPILNRLYWELQVCLFVWTLVPVNTPYKRIRQWLQCDKIKNNEIISQFITVIT